MGRITASRKTLKPDPRFGSILASKFINCLMHDGKKSTAQRVFYGALDIIKEKVQGTEPIDVFSRRPWRMSSRRSKSARSESAGRRIRFPCKSTAIGSSRWRSAGFCISVREKKGRPTHEKLAEELIAGFNREGAAMSKRENVHRMADANKAFAHFAW